MITLIVIFVSVYRFVFGDFNLAVNQWEALGMVAFFEIMLEMCVVGVIYSIVQGRKN